MPTVIRISGVKCADYLENLQNTYKKFISLRVRNNLCYTSPPIKVIFRFIKNIHLQVQLFNKLYESLNSYHLITWRKESRIRDPKFEAGAAWTFYRKEGSLP